MPPPKVHTIRYAGVLGAASKLRSRIVPKRGRPAQEALAETTDTNGAEKQGGSRYWPWAELLKRTFAIELLCPNCQAPMKLLALVRDGPSFARFLKVRGEPTEAPRREPARDSPYFRSKAVRRLASADAP